MDKLAEDLFNIGYFRDVLVNKTGEMAVRGYVLDIFPIGRKRPVRIEFWGDTIESIREFNIDSQLTVERLDNIVITPNTEFLVNTKIENQDIKQREIINYIKPCSLVDYIDGGTIFFDDYNGILSSYKILVDEMAEYAESINIDPKTKFMNELSLDLSNEIINAIYQQFENTNELSNEHLIIEKIMKDNQHISFAETIESQMKRLITMINNESDYEIISFTTNENNQIPQYIRKKDDINQTYLSFEFIEEFKVNETLCQLILNQTNIDDEITRIIQQVRNPQNNETIQNQSNIDLDEESDNENNQNELNNELHKELMNENVEQNNENIKMIKERQQSRQISNNSILNEIMLKCQQNENEMKQFNEINELFKNYTGIYGNVQRNKPNTLTFTDITETQNDNNEELGMICIFNDISLYPLNKNNYHFKKRKNDDEKITFPTNYLCKRFCEIDEIINIHGFMKKENSNDKNEMIEFPKINDESEKDPENCSIPFPL